MTWVHPMLLKMSMRERLRRYVGLKLPRWVITALIMRGELTEEEQAKLKAWLREVVG